MPYNSYNPLIYNTAEQMAYVGAQFIWRATEFIVHFVALPAGVYYGYNTIRSFCLGESKTSEPKPESWVGLLLQLPLSMVKTAVKIGIPQVISHAINHYILQPYWWSWARPAVVAFLHPLMEVLTPPIARILGYGNAGIHWRDLIPGGEGSFWSGDGAWYWNNYATKVLVGIRDFCRNWVIDDLTAPQKVVDNANWAGKIAAKYVLSSLTFVKDFFVGTTRLGTCFSGPEAANQCWQDTRDYFGTNLQGAWDNSEPVRHTVSEAFSKWKDWAIDRAVDAKDMSLNALDALLDKGAEVIANKTGMQVATARGLEVVGLTAVGMFVGWQAVKMSWKVGGKLLEKALSPVQQHQHDHKHAHNINIGNPTSP